MTSLLVTAAFCGALAIMKEARGEPLVGQVAIVFVIRNRMKHDFWPDTVCDVVREPGQFTFSWTYREDSRDLKNAFMIWNAVNPDVITDPTLGSCFYHSTIRRANKAFFRTLKPTVKIGNHQFYACPDGKY